VLFVSIPAADADGRVCRLESLRIDDGEMLLAGATSRLERPAAPR
jgi:hypothetical protein